MPVGPGYFEDRQEPDKKLFVSAGSTVSLPLHKRFVMAKAAAATTTVEFPNVSEAEGFEFIVNVLSASTAGVELDLSNGLSTTTIVSLSTTGVQAVISSDGMDWHVDKS